MACVSDDWAALRHGRASDVLPVDLCNRRAGGTAFALFKESTLHPSRGDQHRSRKKRHDVHAALPTMSDLPPVTQEFYQQSIRLLKRAGVAFLVGGAYALAERTGVVRHTKDFDVFLRREDVERALDAFRRAGYRAEVTFEHWLAKAFHPQGDFIDFIFSSGNGVTKVDDTWFKHAGVGTVFDEPVLLCPVEETIWCKAFVCERERFDGADVNHVLLACGRELDWQRLLARFGPHWRMLLAHLVTFGFVYPGERGVIPAWVMAELIRRLSDETPGDANVCNGTLLSRTQYRRDLELGGYRDARLEAESGMSEEEARVWTEAGVREGHG
jgi:hypothetical protein